MTPVPTLEGPPSLEVRDVTPSKIASTTTTSGRVWYDRTRSVRLFPSAQVYDRHRDLPALLPLWPVELDDVSEFGRAEIIARLRNALRAERRRGLAGHWTYDLGRHANMLRALYAET